MKVISPELGEELTLLYAKLPAAYQRAVAALHTDPPGHALEGEALARFLKADGQASAIVRRIKEIQGEQVQIRHYRRG